VDGIRNAAQNQFNSQDGGRGHGRDRGRATVFGGPGDAGLEDGWMAVRGRPNVHRRWAIPPWHPEVWGTPVNSTPGSRRGSVVIW
jgi:hypothetical protein